MKVAIAWFVVMGTFVTLPSAQSSCGTLPPLTTSTLVLSWTDGTALCTPLTPTCPAGANITFLVQAFGTDFTCTSYTFDWNFGDGASVTTMTPTTTHRYNTAGVYNVTVRIARGDAQLTLPGALPIGITVPAFSTGGLAVLGLCLGLAGLFLAVKSPA